MSNMIFDLVGLNIDRHSCGTSLICVVTFFE